MFYCYTTTPSASIPNTKENQLHHLLSNSHYLFLSLPQPTKHPQNKNIPTTATVKPPF